MEKEKLKDPDFTLNDSEINQILEKPTKNEPKMQPIPSGAKTKPPQDLWKQIERQQQRSRRRIHQRSRRFRPSRNHFGARGPYKSYTYETKVAAIKLAKKYGLTTATKMTKVPRKNIKRWMKLGPERKKGGGRKVQDEAMEEKLFKHLLETKYEICKYKRPDRKSYIKKMAMEFTNYPASFKASKGWLDKFC